MRKLPPRPCTPDAKARKPQWLCPPCATGVIALPLLTDRPQLFFAFDAADSPREEHTDWEGNAALRRQQGDRQSLEFGKVCFLGRIGAKKASLVAALDPFASLTVRSQIALALARPATTRGRTKLCHSFPQPQLIMNRTSLVPTTSLLCGSTQLSGTILMTIHKWMSSGTASALTKRPQQLAITPLPPLSLATLRMRTATLSTTTPPPGRTPPSSEQRPVTSLTPARPRLAALNTRGGMTPLNRSAPLPAFELSGTASAPGRVLLVPVDQMQGPLVQITLPRRGGLGLGAGSGHIMRTRCSRFARLLNATRQGRAKFGMIDVISRLLINTGVDRTLYQGDLPYLAMIRDRIHSKEIILRYIDFVTNLAVYMTITFHFLGPPSMFYSHPSSRLYAMIALPNISSLTTAQLAQASALTSARGCA